MTPFPLTLSKPALYLVLLAIGFGFGFALETSGFNYAPNLAAQFYFKDARVLKVMFTSIIVAMVLVFLAVETFILDYSLIWVPPTYLWPGILGGLIMGVGFIIGGYCPGTSLVAAITGKIDGLFFVLGGIAGCIVFAETERFFHYFYNDSYYGRLTLMDVFHLPIGVVVLLVILMAFFMFWGSEKLEEVIGGKDPRTESKARYGVAALILLMGVGILLIGDPTPERAWAHVAPVKEPLLRERAVYIHPGELLKYIDDDTVAVELLDVRDDDAYNLFHLYWARHVPLEQVDEEAAQLVKNPYADTTLVVVMSNDDLLATEAWKLLVGAGVPNVYILDRGLNHWLEVFGEEDGFEPLPGPFPPETLHFRIPEAKGDRFAASQPWWHHYKDRLQFTPKVKLQKKKAPTGGGCG